MANTPRINRDDQYEKPVQPKRVTGSRSRTTKIPTTGRGAYEGRPTTGKAPNSHRY